MFYIEWSGKASNERYYLGMDGHAEHRFGEYAERKTYATKDEAEADAKLIKKEEGYNVYLSSSEEDEKPSSAVYEDKHGIGYN